MFVQVPDSLLPEKAIREAHIPWTDFLIAVIRMVHLSLHNQLHKNKREEQDNRHTERDFVHGH